MDLALVLQRLYDSEINVTITWLWDGGFEFALISYMEWEDAGKSIDYMKVIASVEPRERPDRPDPWHGVERADQLASAIHDAALGKYPNSSYAKAVWAAELGRRTAARNSQARDESDMCDIGSYSSRPIRGATLGALHLATPLGPSLSHP